LEVQKRCPKLFFTEGNISSGFLFSIELKISQIGDANHLKFRLPKHIHNFEGDGNKEIGRDFTPGIW